MPFKNSLQKLVSEYHYHVYNRATNRNLFRDDEDCAVFLKYLNRYLTPKKTERKNGGFYANYAGAVTISSFSLMPSHFHLVTYVLDTSKTESFFRALFNSYSQYYNKKYVFEGSLFSGPFRRKRVLEDAYLVHLHKYVITNSDTWETDKFSCIEYMKLRHNTNTYFDYKLFRNLFHTHASMLQALRDFTTNETLKDYIESESVTF
jgi:REP element-mobilizing transposase RayT